MAVRILHGEFTIVCDTVDEAIAFMELVRNGARAPKARHAHYSIGERDKCTVCRPDLAVASPIMTHKDLWMRARIQRLARRGMPPEEIAKRTGTTLVEVECAMSTMRSIVGIAIPEKSKK